jgi:hypothetical protein
LLDGVPATHVIVRVYRVTLTSTGYARAARIRAAVGSGPEFQEALDFLSADVGLITVAALADLLTLPFKKPRKGRFSDGSHGVLYTAVERETAGQEYCHWAPIVFGAGIGRAFRVRVHLISCQFEGATKDVRLLLSSCPWLTMDDHTECQRLGADAKAEGLAGLFAPSARRPGGSTVPIFIDSTVSAPVQEGEVHVTIDPLAPTGAIATFAIV